MRIHNENTDGTVLDMTSIAVLRNTGSWFLALAV
jgi:hypothetical protein